MITMKTKSEPRVKSKCQLHLDEARCSKNQPCTEKNFGHGFQQRGIHNKFSFLSLFFYVAGA